MWADALSTFRCVAKALRSMPGMSVEDALGEATADDIAREYAFLQQQAVKRNQPAAPKQRVILRETADPRALDIFLDDRLVGSFQWHAERPPRIIMYSDGMTAVELTAMETIIKFGKAAMAI